jgi:hypothetical protein
MNAPGCDGSGWRSGSCIFAIAIGGRTETAPTEWLNPPNGVNYQVVVQTPQYRIDSIQSL